MASNCEMTDKNVKSGLKKFSFTRMKKKHILQQMELEHFSVGLHFWLLFDIFCKWYSRFEQQLCVIVLHNCSILNVNASISTVYFYFLDSLCATLDSRSTSFILLTIFIASFSQTVIGLCSSFFLLPSSFTASQSFNRSNVVARSFLR